MANRSHPPRRELERSAFRRIDFTVVAIDPNSHPLDEEIERIFEGSPGLRQELDGAVGEIERGEADLVDHEEVLRTLGRPMKALR